MLSRLLTLPLFGRGMGGGFLFIDWQPSVEAFSIGPVVVRWYALCWVLGIMFGFFFVRGMYKQEQIDPVPDRHGKLQPTGKFDPLLFYCFFHGNIKPHKKLFPLCQALYALTCAPPKHIQCFVRAEYQQYMLILWTDFMLIK